MALMVGRFFIVVLVMLSAAPVQALDFDKEIKKQEQTVSVKYVKPPHQLAYFLKQYESCKTLIGSRRSQCNVTEAKRRYFEYSYAWQQQQQARQNLANVSVGEMNVMLEKKGDGPF